MNKIVRIGGASAFWGDSATGPGQLVHRAQIDYLVFDYLAETTMAILAGQRRRNPSLGFATDFVEVAMRDVLSEVLRKGIKVVTNAGGLNPRGCAEALRQFATKQGLKLRVAVVEGDDVSDRIENLEAFSLDAPDSRLAVPAGLLSANLYLGALPIARALEAGADVVVTGRCVDSAVTLGPLIKEFGWKAGDYDLLAAGSLAGHIIECGCQATGGLFTDWQEVPDWADIGYPIAEVRSDGTFDVTKPLGTGGLVCAAGVAEQMLYEIGDPAAYELPDVICDLRNVEIQPSGVDRVRVSGARGYAPSNRYKLSGTYLQGFRSQATLVIIGIDAAAKARRTGAAILERTRAMFSARGFVDYSAATVEVIGAETIYGPHARRIDSREVTMRVAVAHESKAALELFSGEIMAAATSWAPGTTTPPNPRPSVSPRIMQFNALVAKDSTTISFILEADAQEVDIPSRRPAKHPDRALDEGGPTATVPVARSGSEAEVPVRLIDLAYARSGDKGDLSNIGIIARTPEYLPLILQKVTSSVVGDYFRHLVKGPIRRYLVPGIHACNFVMENALDGGGPASLRMDPLGKGMAQILLDLEILVPQSVARHVRDKTDNARTRPQNQG